MPYIPHTEHDIEQMLKRIGVKTTADLFDEIPAKLQVKSSNKTQLPERSNEMMVRLKAHNMAKQLTSHRCFIGAGSYEHHIPAAVWEIASRGEFLTAYTPYQAEASQGTLQLLYEFQTMMAELTGMEVANASLYDGATALAEAILMAIRLNKKSQSKCVLVPETLHPFYRQTLKTILSNQQIEIISLPFDPKTGITPLNALDDFNDKDISALVIAHPNFFGCLEEVDALTNWAASQHIISIACVNPLSLALLKPPGVWGEQGVDIVCGEGQPLGVPMASGGPYFGFLSTRLAFVRQMPGRLIGRTFDADKKSGFTLTLQAREQHIRRGKATSNICTNQGLLTTAATIYMSLLGPEGLKAVACASHQNTQFLASELTKIPGVKQVFSRPFFHEVVIEFNGQLDNVLNQLGKAGIDGGYPLQTHYPALNQSLLICATETRTQTDLDDYIQAVRHALNA
ncbi:MAG TPA: aminomethyl-transferring glycine dehydrogenase subunit GcvPA [Legionellales bacterium]|nr:aminomethyl-transferring glycine dehydrogenase subunit GcvPA [Legionellales bacterium]HCA89019.1 aminomethyl-transferring glycine dehydrogenase subunit GcvPA [Legionellales bacterium]|tara:strand:- start:1148 stop:2515 length:1368 start_codon:yes stop_codon:yes gene_type:complete